MAAARRSNMRKTLHECPHSVRLYPDQHQAVHAIAKRQGWTVAHTMRWVLSVGLALVETRHNPNAAQQGARVLAAGAAGNSGHGGS
jgi:hypothetical protein